MKKVAFASLLVLFSILTIPAFAQGGPAILRNEVRVNYPQNMTFQLEVDDSSSIAEAELIYAVEQISCLDATTTVPVEVDGNNIEWTWEMVRSGNPPPGAALWWQWQLTLADGQTITTPRQEHTFTDERFDWQTVSADKIHLHWYEGQNVGPMLLDAAVSGLDTLQNEMGITLEDDVQLYIYGDSADMREAVLYIQDWAGGVAFSEYNIILMGVPPNIAESWGKPTVRHELAHLVIGQYGRSCVGGSRPTWLNEGLAVVAEGPPQAHILADIEAGIENNSFEPLRSLNGPFSSHGPDAGIAYSQSYSVVDFMLNEFGQEKMQQLLLTLADGTTYDTALEAVYGTNVDGIEQAWRRANDLPERTIPPTPTPVQAANIPTIVPQDVPQSLATPPSANATAVPQPTQLPPTTQPGSSLCTAAMLPMLVIGLALTNRRKQEKHS